MQARWLPSILENGKITKELRVDLTYEPLVKFAKTLSADDEVVIEATGNSNAVERLMRPYVKRIAVANSRWFGRSPMPGSKPIGSMPLFSLACKHQGFCRKCGSPTRRPQDVRARLLSGWEFLSRSFD